MALDSGVVYVSYATGGAGGAANAFTLCTISANRRMTRVASANAHPDGVFYEAPTAAGDIVPIADWRRSSSLRVRAGGAITDSHFVKAANDGEVVSDGASGSANSIGKCIGGGAANEIVQIVPIERYA